LPFVIYQLFIDANISGNKDGMRGSARIYFTVNAESKVICFL